MSDDVSAPSRTEEEVGTLVHEIVLELAPEPDEQVSSDAKLVDALGYHSLGLLELAFTLEDEFGLPPIDEETARKILTIADVQRHVTDGLRAEGKLAE